MNRISLLFHPENHNSNTRPPSFITAYLRGAAARVAPGPRWGGFYQYLEKRTCPPGGGLSSFLFVLRFYKLRVNLESVPGYNSRVPQCGISLQEEECVCVFCGWCVAAIESLTTSPGVFHLSKVEFLQRSEVLHTTLVVKSFSQTHWTESGVGGVCEGTRGEFHPDPGQSPAEAAENTKHLLEGLHRREEQQSPSFCRC